MNIPKQLAPLAGRLIVSCQAPDGDVFREPSLMALFAQASLAGGAAAIRANGPLDIQAIRKITSVPILGIHKEVQEDGQILITPSFEQARGLVAAGADMIALDATARGQRFGAIDRIRRIKNELNVPVLADIATVEEAVEAVRAGADAVLSTMRGYTADTSHITRFEPEFIAQLTEVSQVPVIAEGRIYSPDEARAAIAAGAFAVVIGTAITRPRDLTRRFAAAIDREHTKQRADRKGKRCFLGIDLGGTNTKFGVVSPSGDLLFESHVPTPAMSGRHVLLNHLKGVAGILTDRSRELALLPSALGIATAGWVDPSSGRVAYATENLPGWTGAPIAETLRETVDLPVAVENDANALAVAEKYFGAGRGLRDFIAITLGTGVGGGCYVRGRLNRGAHFFANALGHISLIPDGLLCTCGQRGCLEMYTNAAALISYADSKFQTAEELIAAANAGDSTAKAAVQTYAAYLARGCGTLLHLLDPEALILSGGLAQNNTGLITKLKAELSNLVPAWAQRKLAIVPSPLGYCGGVLGAAAVAMEMIQP